MNLNSFYSRTFFILEHFFEFEQFFQKKKEKPRGWHDSNSGISRRGGAKLEQLGYWPHFV